MEIKWIGAILIIVSCGGVGFSIAGKYRRKERQLRQLLDILRFMESELQFRLTPLPELCKSAGKHCNGVLRNVFLDLARELDWQSAPDAGSCMNAALRHSHELAPGIRRLLQQLGNTLGNFDLRGQLRGIKAVETSCREELNKLTKTQDIRLRSYQTLGLCAGTALAILFA